MAAMKSELTPEVLAEMRQRAAYWGPPSREQCIGEDHMARDVLELLDEIERLRAEAEELRSETEQAVQAIERWMPLTDSLPVAIHKIVNEIERLRAGLRDAFDAGARAMRDAVLEQDDYATHTPDITQLPGRPE